MSATHALSVTTFSQLAPAKPPRPAKVGPFRRLLRQVMIRA